MTPAVDVAIIGAGFSGIGAAVALSQGGIEDYLVRNIAIGILFAGVSGVVYGLIQRWSGGDRRWASEKWKTRRDAIFLAPG